MEKIFKFFKKITEFANSCPTPLFCLSCKLPGIKPGSTAELQTTLTNKPNTQVKECYLYMYMKPFRSAKWRTFISQWSLSISQYFFSQNPKCLFILFQYNNVYLCAKFGDLEPTIDKKHRPQIQTCF